MSIIEHFKPLIESHEKIQQAKKEYIQQFKDLSQIAIAETFKKLDGRFPGFVIRGYTPSFNDGDDCVHSSDSFYISECADYGVATDVAKVIPTNIEDKWGDPTWLEDTLTSQESNDMEKIIDIFESFAEDVYKTNYLLIAGIGSAGQVVFYVNENYDCGY